MKKGLVLLLIFPLLLRAQDQNEPYIRFDQGTILFYIPSQGSQRLLPAYKPGFVHILQTPGILTLPPQELSGHLESGIHLIAGGAKQKNRLSPSMTSAQKTTFLESYACLILLKYSGVSKLDSMFYNTAVTLQEDSDPEVRTNAGLVVRMIDMYRMKEK
jgi:hypothetical protein